MEVSLSGFSSHSDTLHIATPQAKRIRWYYITGILSISGVSHYYIQGETIGIGYGKVNPEIVAAEALRVIADAFHISTDKLVIIIDERSRGDLATRLANNIWQRIETVATPEPVFLNHVKTEGDLPSYHRARK